MEKGILSTFVLAGFIEAARPLQLLLPLASPELLQTPPEASLNKAPKSQGSLDDQSNFRMRLESQKALLTQTRVTNCTPGRTPIAHSYLSSSISTHVRSQSGWGVGLPYGSMHALPEHRGHPYLWHNAPHTCCPQGPRTWLLSP